MQPFSPGPCRFVLDSRKALKVSENMPFICDDQVPISLCLACSTTLNCLYTQNHFANVILLLIIAKKALNEIAINGAKIYNSQETILSAGLQDHRNGWR
jgi:hypothetical protein